MSDKRLVSISRPRYRDLCRDWLNGELAARWPDGKAATTKAEKTEEQQIRAIAIIMDKASDRTREILRGDNWTQIHLVDRGNGDLRVDVELRKPIMQFAPGE